MRWPVIFLVVFTILVIATKYPPNVKIFYVEHNNLDVGTIMTRRKIERIIAALLKKFNKKLTEDQSEALVNEILRKMNFTKIMRRRIDMGLE